MSNFYGATSLTGGGQGALDAINGDTVSDGDGAIVIIDGRVMTFRLNGSSSEIENYPEVIVPDINAGTKRWIRQHTWGLGDGDEKEVTISSGAIDVTSSRHTVDTEGVAAADDLTNVNIVGLQQRILLMLRCEDPARVVTVKHNAGGAGQFYLHNGLDFDLDSDNKFILLERQGDNFYEVQRFTPNIVKSDEPATLETGYDANSVEITDGASPTINLTKGNFFHWNLGADRTFPVLSPSKSGKWEFTISGNYNLDLNTNWTDEVSEFGDTEYTPSLSGFCAITLEAFNRDGTIVKRLLLRNMS